MKHAPHVYARETEATGVHNCPKCGALVVWGETTKGKRGRFDYPADEDGEYPNHHITCWKERHLRLVK